MGNRAALVRDPLFWLLAGYVLFVGRNVVRLAAALAGAGAVLFHLGYLATIAVPALTIAAWIAHRERIGRRDLLRVAVPVATALALCLPQAWVLASVHLRSDHPQAGGLALALAQTAMTTTIGTAAFPLAPLPLFFGVVCAITLLALRGRRLEPPWQGVIALLVAGGAILTLSGIGYRPRNATWLHLPFLVLSAMAIDRLAAPWRWLAIGVAVAFQAQSTVNVVAHAGTTKRSFDTPYPAALIALDRLGADCSPAVIAHHDVVLGYLLEQRGRAQVGAGSGETRLRLPAGSCLIVVDSWRGEFPAERVARWSERIARLDLARDDAVVVGRDEQWRFKSWLAGEPVPPAMLRLTRYRLTRAQDVRLGF